MAGRRGIAIETNRTSGEFETTAVALRRRAEEKARANRASTLGALSPETARKVLQELRVHQIELEMQNEELRRTQAELEASRARYFDLYDLAPVGYFTLNEKGLILEANLTAATLLGVARSALVKRPMSRFILPEDRDTYYRQLIELFAPGAPRERCGESPVVFELRMLRVGVDPCWAQVKANATQDTDGALVCRAVVTDVTERKRAQQALEESQRSLEAAVETAPSLVVLTDPEGRIVLFNRACEELTGYDRKEVVGRTIPELFLPREWIPVFQKRFADPYAPEVPGPHENPWKTKAGEERLIEWRYTVLPSPLDGRPRLLGTGIDITERKQAEQELLQSREQLRALTVHWQTSIEAERAHIAREIHDDFGQSMTALKMDLDWLAKRLPRGDERVDRIRDMTDLVDNTIAQMRQIASSLRPGLLDDLGLAAALEWQTAEFGERTGIVCELSLPPRGLDLDQALSTTLFRIAQETLTNVARHAEATRVEASLQQEGKSLVLTICDNGRGITESEIKDPRSLGLLGLRERAAQWGGETVIRGAAGKGTSVTVRIPLPASPVIGGKR